MPTKDLITNNCKRFLWAPGRAVRSTPQRQFTKYIFTFYFLIFNLKGALRGTTSHPWRKFETVIISAVQSFIFSIKSRKRHFLKSVSILVCCSLIMATTQAQQGFLTPSDHYNPARLRTVVASEIGIGILATTGLYFLWYRKHPMNHFHMFNDNSEWLQMDKIGHATAAYNVASIQYDMMRWCGVQNQPSLAIGAITAVTYMSIIEILDGFSSQWGFSKGDMAANIIGATLFASQQKIWSQQRVSLKFSYHQTIYPQYHPAELGRSWKESMIKDYNGQTYWLSFNIKSFLPTNNNFPAWLNLDLGYSGEGMTGATVNPTKIDGKPIPYFKRYRQFYLAPDIDFNRISSPNSLFNAFGYATKTIKFPAPTLELNTLKQVKFHPIYF